MSKRRYGLGVSVALVGLLVAGCGGGGNGGGGGGMFGGMFGGGTPAAPQQAAASSAAGIQAGAPTVYAPVTCPPIAIQSGTETLISYAGAAQPSNVRYQATIGETARECTLSGGVVTLKVGMTGRVIIGPAGAPGTFSVPLRIAVTRGFTEPVYSELRPLSVPVPAGQTSATFTHVEENVTFQLGADAITSYRVLIGFDEAR